MQRQVFADRGSVDAAAGRPRGPTWSCERRDGGLRFGGLLLGGLLLGGLLLGAITACGGGTVTVPDNCPNGEADCPDAASCTPGLPGCPDATTGCAPGLPGCPDATPAGCPDGQVDCGAGCIDVQANFDHCGGCDQPCADGQACEGGTCVAGTACTSDCASSGVRECAGAGWHQCGQYDGDACLEWSGVTDCSTGQACDPGTAACVATCGDYCDPFAVVLIPDTQYYTNKWANNDANPYRKQMRWILANRVTENVKTAIHLGDITNNNTAEQWVIADAAHAILDGDDMPYSVVPGNHDYKSSSGWERGDSLFEDYFSASRFQGRTWYGGKLGGDNTNNYTFFEQGPMKFMVVSLEYAPRKDTLCRAEQLIASHPERQVIIATHCYLTKGGNYAGCPDETYTTLGANGRAVWDELASRYSNVFMVVSGHVGESAYVPRQGNTGNTVHQLVVDYQFEAACSASAPAQCNDHCQANTYSGNGWLREMIFDPAARTVRAHTFTVEDGNTNLFPGGVPRFFCSELNGQGKDWYPSDPAAIDHAFTFGYDPVTMPAFARSDGGKLAFLDRKVNSVGTGNQLAPRVAPTATGGTVVVWQDNSSGADGDGNFDIMARGFAPGGCQAFADVVVNPDTAGQQQTPAVATDSAGNFVVAWADDKDSNGTFQIYARGFNADGSQRFPVMVVNSASAGQQLRPVVAMAPDGRFVVAWEDDQDSDGQAQIWVRGFNADGSQRFADQSVHTDVAGVRVAPAISSDAGAGFVVAWQDDSDGNGTYQIHARGFNADGSQRFARITVNSVADGQQRKPAVGVDASGAFVVAWEDDPDGDGTYRVMARGFTAAGGQRIADFVVPTTAAGHLVPAIAMAADGTFIVTWQDDPDGNGTYQIHARGFTAAGAELMSEWTVNRNAAGQQLAPDVATAGGTIAVVWQDDMDGNGAYELLARGFDLP